MNIKEKYFSLLKTVEKPACYTGGEFNMLKKSWAPDYFKIALIFPDAYIVGESSLSLKILYHIINENPNFLAERFFTPARDFEEKLLGENLPVLSMENFKPLKEFDIAGFTIQHELTYTNILTVLNLSGLAFKAEERNETDPIICAGGPGIFNPEPIADVFDFIFLGEAEDSIIGILDAIKQLKSAGKKKIEILEEINLFEYIYVPRFYECEYNQDNTVKEVKNTAAAKSVKKRIIKDFNMAPVPPKPLVPYVESIHDRVAVEIFRGCARGCRFCQAGMIYRPVRERSLDKVFEGAAAALQNSGFEELSFVSLNCADYSNITPLLLDVKSKLKNISVSLPSLRVDAFNEELAYALSLPKRSSLTFAPEAGSQRLRVRINKTASEEDILNAVKIAKKYGWKLVKLYFMIGLPDEQIEDLDAIVDMVRKILKETGLNLNISIASFVPKPHTPFQWEGQLPRVELEERIAYLRKRLRHGRIKLSFHNTRQSFVEAALAKGSRKVFEVIKTAFALGCRFDGWTDSFSFENWMAAFSSRGVSPEFYAQRQIPYAETTPWDHINCGVAKQFLIDEHKKSEQGITTPDCRRNACSGCGVCPELDARNDLTPKAQAKVFYAGKARNSSSGVCSWRYRVKYAKTGVLRFTGHLDVLRTFIRALRRAELPIAYKGEFHPRMKISASYPLSLFYTSDSEYLDVELTQKLPAEEIREKLARELPEEMAVLEVKSISRDSKSLMACFRLVDYRIILNGEGDIGAALEKLSLKNTIFVERKQKEIEKNKVLRSIEYNNGSGHRLNITLNILDEGGCKPTDILRALGIKDEQVEEIKRVGFR